MSYKWLQKSDTRLLRKNNRKVMKELVGGMVTSSFGLRGFLIALKGEFEEKEFDQNAIVKYLKGETKEKVQSLQIERGLDTLNIEMTDPDPSKIKETKSKIEKDGALFISYEVNQLLEPEFKNNLQKKAIVLKGFLIYFNSKYEKNTISNLDGSIGTILQSAQPELQPTSVAAAAAAVAPPAAAAAVAASNVPVYPPSTEYTTNREELRRYLHYLGFSLSGQRDDSVALQDLFVKGEKFQDDDEETYKMLLFGVRDSTTGGTYRQFFEMCRELNPDIESIDSSGIMSQMKTIVDILNNSSTYIVYKRNLQTKFTGFIFVDAAA